MPPSDLLVAFFACAVAFLLAAAALAVGQAAGAWSPGRWLVLHLAFVGGISQLVLGAGQFFACAFLATAPPGRGLVRCQLAAWNIGTLLLAVAVPARDAALTGLAAVALLIALALFAVSLRAMRRRSLQHAPWAVRWYQAAAGLFAAGIVLGAMLASGTYPGSDPLAAHMALNVGGWFGTAIIGTLHTFFPSLTETRLPRPRLQGPCFSAWVGGVVALAVGLLAGLPALAGAGWVLLAVGAVVLGVNLAGCLLHSRRRTLSVGLLAVAHGLLLGGLLVAGAAAIDSGLGLPPAPWRGVLFVLLLAGWLAMTVLGALVHLLGVMQRVRGLLRVGGAGPPTHTAEMPAWPAAVPGLAVLASAASTALELAVPRTVALTVLAATYLAVSAVAVRALIAALRAALLEV